MVAEVVYLLRAYARNPALTSWCNWKSKQVGDQLHLIEYHNSNWNCLFMLCKWIDDSPNYTFMGRE